MDPPTCKDCPILAAALALLHAIEKASPYLYSPPRKKCATHALLEVGREIVMVNAHICRKDLRRYHVEGYPSE